MRFGVSTFVTDEGIGPAELGRALEERGFAALYVAEHTHIPVSRATPYPGGGDLPRVYYRTLDPIVVLTAAAVVTERLTLGTGIALIPQRDPIVFAKEIASLDLISGGRAAVGIGGGWNREEMRDHGTDPRTRGALLNEQLPALKAIWTKDEAEFHGEYVDFDPVFQWPKPVSKPHPPVYIGGDSAFAAARAGRLGDGWLPHAVRDPGQVKAQLAARPAGVPVTVTSASPAEELLAAYAEAGADRVTLALPVEPEVRTMRRLDELAVFAARYE
jgi:probable F420-dependent oxidoreductase